VTSKIKWTNSVGITKVKVEMFKEGNGGVFNVSLAMNEIPTTQVNSNAIK